jgi:hypothetical protein
VVSGKREQTLKTPETEVIIGLEDSSKRERKQAKSVGGNYKSAALPIELRRQP